MNKQILEQSAKLLEIAADKFSNHGCNDFELPNTPENRELVTQLEFWNDPNFDISELSFEGETIYVQDWFLMKYCAEKLSKYVRLK